MKRASLLIFLFILMQFAPASAAVNAMLSENGALIDAFVLPNGGSLSIILKETAGMKQIIVFHNQRNDEMVSQPILLPINAEPDRILVGICNDRVHLFINWLTGYELSTAPVYEYVVTLNENTGICEYRSYKNFLPSINSAPSGG